MYVEEEKHTKNLLDKRLAMMDAKRRSESRLALMAKERRKNFRQVAFHLNLYSPFGLNSPLNTVHIVSLGRRLQIFHKLFSNYKFSFLSLSLSAFLFFPRNAMEMKFFLNQTLFIQRTISLCE